MKYVSHALFAAGVATIIYLIARSLKIPNPDWLMSEGVGIKMIAVMFFAAAGAAHFIWGDRKDSTTSQPE